MATTITVVITPTTATQIDGFALGIDGLVTAAVPMTMDAAQIPWNDLYPPRSTLPGGDIFSPERLEKTVTSQLPLARARL